jgi:hypothetical protein
VSGGLEVDRYDVEAMIRDVRPDIRAEIAAAVREAVAELRDEIGYERKAREDAEASLWRVLNSRTEHLV